MRLCRVRQLHTPECSGELFWTWRLADLMISGDGPFDGWNAFTTADTQASCSARLACCGGRAFVEAGLFEPNFDVVVGLAAV